MEFTKLPAQGETSNPVPSIFFAAVIAGNRARGARQALKGSGSHML